MQTGLGEFLREYENKYPDDVLHVDTEVDAKWKLSAICFRAEKTFKEPPVMIFHKVRTIQGNVSTMPVVLNLFASRRRCARALGASFETFGRDLYSRKRERRKPEIIDRKEAPVRQVIQKEDIDLRRLPVPVYHDWDAGPYLTAGFLTCIDRDTRVDNCALQRGFISDKREIRFWATEESHNNWILRDWESKGEDAPIAYWIGHHPAAYFGTQGKLGYKSSHYEAAGGVLGDNIRLVPSETLGDDFLVPADAEIVIEGRVPAGLRKPEGPFGECRGYTGGQRFNPVIEVTAVTCRKDAMWLGLLCGHKDYTAGLATYWEGLVYEKVNSIVPVSKIYVPPSGMGMTLYLAIKQTTSGQATEAITSALAGTGIKQVLVFDDDIDIFDESEVLFALSTRTQWDRDVYIYRNFRGDQTDPAVNEDGSTSKGGIDCTLPIGQGTFERRNIIPQEVIDSVNLDDYIKVRAKA